MLSVLSRLGKNDGKKSNMPSPMSSSLQKKFSRGVDYNMKIVIKGDRNVGKSCLLQRLQGGAFIDEYRSTDEIQIAPIHWKYKDTEHIIKVEVWEVVDKGRAKAKNITGLKLENSTIPPPAETLDVPLDANFLDVYANANGVIMMMDITKTWTFEYIKREITAVPPDIPIIILGNHCDMHHYREVNTYQVEQLLSTVKQNRAGVVRYAETSMRNGFGLRLLHKFFNIPFLQLQRTTLLNQLNVNAQEMNRACEELDEFELSEGADYDAFLDKLTTKRKENISNTSNVPRIASEKSPSIVLGAGKPIVPPSTNPLAQANVISLQNKFQQQQQALKNNPNTSSAPVYNHSSEKNPGSNSVQIDNSSLTSPTTAKENIDDFCPGVLDHSFLDDLSPTNKNFSQGLPASNYGEKSAQNIDSDSGGEDTVNPLVLGIEDDLDSAEEAEYSLSKKLTLKTTNSVAAETTKSRTSPRNTSVGSTAKESHFKTAESRTSPYSATKETQFKPIEPNQISDNYNPYGVNSEPVQFGSGYEVQQPTGYDSSPTWPLDGSVRRSPEGGEAGSYSVETKKESKSKDEKKHKKSKKSSKDKEKSKDSDKEKKHREKKHKKKSSADHLEEFLSGPADKVVEASSYEAL